MHKVGKLNHMAPLLWHCPQLAPHTIPIFSFEESFQRPFYMRSHSLREPVGKQSRNHYMAPSHLLLFQKTVGLQKGNPH